MGPFEPDLKSYVFDMPQYGVSSSNDAAQMMQVGSGFASAIPYIGPVLGAAMNIGATYFQNEEQRRMYAEYMSPSSRMAQMKAAGINPNAAAQGISGSSPSQMNAASPSSAFGTLGEALGNSVNTSLTAANIAAQTRNLDKQTEAQDIVNKMNEVELGMKPSILSAELDDLRESANERRQAVEQSKSEVNKIYEEIEKLKKEQLLIEAQEGAIEFENRLRSAEERLANAKKALTESEKALTDVNKDIQEKERDNYLSPSDKIKLEASESAKAPYENTPQGRVKQLYLEQMQRELAPLRWQLEHLEKNHAPYYAIRSIERRMQRVIREYRNKMRRVDRGFAAGANFAGYGLNAGG